MSIANKLIYFIFFFIKGYDFFIFDRLRVKLVNVLLYKSSDDLYVRSGVTIHGFETLSIGNDVSINHGCFISAVGGLTIGDYVAIGHNTSIITTEHSFNDPQKPIKYQPILKKPTKIGSNVWIGANVTILAGISIASNTIIAAGAVVTKSVVNENTIVGGCPAKFIKKIQSGNE